MAQDTVPKQLTAFQREHRRRQAQWKRTWPGLPDAARQPGHWKAYRPDFILPAAFADKNIWEPIRQELLEYFRANKIAWHDQEQTAYGPRDGAGPSPHLLDSQVSGVNFWWGLARSPKPLRTALRYAFDDVESVVAPKECGPLVEAEWVGLCSYLGERGWPQRGQYATSADLLLASVDEGGERHGVLLESKYTEAYQPERWLDCGPSGQTRIATYQPYFERADGPIRQDFGIGLADLLIEPFYQHLRQQLLAGAMEREKELGFETVTCLHVAPRANAELHARITAPKLADRGTDVGEAWRSVLRQPTRYRSVAYEDVFNAVVGVKDPAVADWVEYQRARYGWDR